MLPVSFYIDKNGVVAVQTAGVGLAEKIEENIKKIIGSGGSAECFGATSGVQVAGVQPAVAGVR